MDNAEGLKIFQQIASEIKDATDVKMGGGTTFLLMMRSLFVNI